MTPNELAIFMQLLRMSMRYENSNPEVGMGPSWDMIALQAARSLPQLDIDAETLRDLANEAARRERERDW